MNDYIKAVNKHVICEVLTSSKKYYQKTIGLKGIVEREGLTIVALSFKEVSNPASSSGYFWYKKEEVRYCSKFENENNTEEIIMTGNFKIVAVNMLEGLNTSKRYHFAAFEDFEVNDYVLCDTEKGFSIAKVVEVFDQTECSVMPTKEIICKIDMSAFNQRKINREKAKKIKKDMDSRIEKFKEVQLYAMMAEKDPELKEMLDQYIALA